MLYIFFSVMEELWNYLSILAQAGDTQTSWYDNSLDLCFISEWHM